MYNCVSPCSTMLLPGECFSVVEPSFNLTPAHFPCVFAARVHDCALKKLATLVRNPTTELRRLLLMLKSTYFPFIIVLLLYICYLDDLDVIKQEWEKRT